MSDAQWTWLCEQVIASDCSEGRRVIEELLSQLELHGWDSQEVFGVHLAMDEALANAIRHGNGRDESKRIHLSFRLSPERLQVEVADEGPGFDPQEVPDCTHPENLERPCGRGIMLMRCFMSHVAYNDRGNAVSMEKVRCCEAKKSAS
jgi:serine/threonine-protein kinase RsbW